MEKLLIACFRTQHVKWCWLLGARMSPDVLPSRGVLRAAVAGGSAVWGLLPVCVGPGERRDSRLRCRSSESVQESDVVLRIRAWGQGSSVVLGSYSQKSVCVGEARAFFGSIYSPVKSGIEIDFIILFSVFDGCS